MKQDRFDGVSLMSRHGQSVNTKKSIAVRLLGKIPVALIDLDRAVLDRRSLNIANYLAAGHSVPPIHVKRWSNGRFGILDGRHRVTAAKLLRRKYILAKWGEQYARKYI